MAVTIENERRMLEQRSLERSVLRKSKGVQGSDAWKRDAFWMALEQGESFFINGSLDLEWTLCLRMGRHLLGESCLVLTRLGISSPCASFPQSTEDANPSLMLSRSTKVQELQSCKERLLRLTLSKDSTTRTSVSDQVLVLICCSKWIGPRSWAG